MTSRDKVSNLGSLDCITSEIKVSGNSISVVSVSLTRVDVILGSVLKGTDDSG